MSKDPKHISQLNPGQRAKAQQTVQEALQLIISQQAGPVFISYDALDQAAKSGRLIIEEGYKNAGGLVGVRLSVQAATGLIETPSRKH